MPTYACKPGFQLPICKGLQKRYVSYVIQSDLLLALFPCNALPKVTIAVQRPWSEANLLHEIV